MTAYRITMLPAQFEDLAVDLGRREINEAIDAGKISVTILSFADLHDYIDANCLAGLADDALRPVYLSVYPVVDEQDQAFVSAAFEDAVTRIQGRLNDWIRAVDGMGYQRAFAAALTKNFDDADVASARRQLQSYPAQSSFWLTPGGVEALVMRGRGLL